MLKTKIKCKKCNSIKKREEMSVHKDTGYSRGYCKSCCLTRIKKYGVRGGYEVYRPYKKEFCEMCGFRGLECQLDVNHRDANHLNNKEDNLETLCSNCHRLVTFILQRSV
jgi:hypothetical protein